MRLLSLCLFSSLSIARSFRAYFHALSRSVSLCFALFVILSSTTRRRRRFGAAQPKLIASVVRQPSPFSFRFVSRCISWRRRRHRHHRRRCVVSFRDVLEQSPSPCRLCRRRVPWSRSALCFTWYVRARVGVLGRQRLRLRSDCAASRYTLRSNVCHYFVVVFFVRCVLCSVNV